jgi:hypothetical protein
MAQIRLAEVNDYQYGSSAYQTRMVTPLFDSSRALERPGRSKSFLGG